MNNKLIITLVVPRLCERYNILLPINKNMGNIIILLNKALSDMIGEDYKINNSAVIYDADNGEIIDSSKFVCETSIRNGSTLIMI